MLQAIFSKLKTIVLLSFIGLLFTFAACSKKTELINEKDFEVLGELTKEASTDCEKASGKPQEYFLPLESEKKFVHQGLSEIDTSNFTEDVPKGFYAAGTFIVPNEGVSAKVYAAARADEKRYYGEFKTGEIAVIENYYEYREIFQRPDYVWFQICILSSGMEGWIKVYKNKNDFKFSCVNDDFGKDSYMIHSANADMEVSKKAGAINRSQERGRGYSDVAISPLGDEFIMNINGTLYRYDIGSDSEKTIIDGDNDDFIIEKNTKCAYSKDGDKIYILNCYGNLFSYDLETEEATKLPIANYVEGYYYYPKNLCLSPDQRFIFSKTSISVHGQKEHTMLFVYDQQKEKQYFFYFSPEKNPDKLCENFSDFVITKTNDAYASCWNYEGDHLFLHFYLDSDDKYKVEKFEQEKSLELICANPSGDQLLSFDRDSGMLLISDTKGNITYKKYILFGSPIDPYPELCCVNPERTMAVFSYPSDEGFENYALYSLTSHNLLGLIKNLKSDGLDIAELSGSTLIVSGIGSRSYNAYTFSIAEKENQFDFSIPCSEEVEKLCGTSYSRFEFYSSEKTFDDMTEGPNGIYINMTVKFYPNGFYKIVSQKSVEDTWALGTIYGSYEIQWPKVRLFTASQRHNGDYDIGYNPEDFHGLPLVEHDYADTKESVEMIYDENQEYPDYSLAKIECNF